MRILCKARLHVLGLQQVHLAFLQLLDLGFLDDAGEDVLLKALVDLLLHNIGEIKDIDNMGL